MATKITKIPSKAMQKRIMKAGEVSDADAELYIKQVGMETLQSMSLDPENIKEYLKNITELGNTQPKKKKLPIREKIEDSDSVLVADGDDKISKVKVKKTKVRKSKTKKEEEVFESESETKPKEKMTFKSFTKKTSEKAFDLGLSMFDKMFPNVAKFMNSTQTKLDNQTKKVAEFNYSTQVYAREIERSSVLLQSITESQNRANITLQKILDVVAASNQPATSPAIVPPPPGGNPPPGNRNANTAPPPASQPPAGRTPRSRPAAAAGSNLARNATIGAGVATAATLGAGGILAATSGSRSETSGQTTPTPAPAPAAGSNAPRTPAESVRAERGIFRRAGSAGNYNFAYERAENGRYYIDEREVDAQTYNRFRQLAVGIDERRDPRYRQYMQEAAARDDFAPAMTAETRIRQENSAELTNIIGRVRTQPPADRSAPAPVAPLTPAAAPAPTATTTPAAAAPITSGALDALTSGVRTYARTEPLSSSTMTASATPTSISDADTLPPATPISRPQVAQLEQQADQSRREVFLRNYRTRIEEIIIQNLERTKDAPDSTATQQAARAIDLLNEGKLDEALEVANRMASRRSNEEYTVKRGDTLTSIARSFGVSVQELMNANNITNRNAIRIGQIIKAPGRTAAQIQPTTPATPTAVAEPPSVRAPLEAVATPMAVPEPPSVRAPAAPTAITELAPPVIPPAPIAPAATQVETPTASGFDARLLHIKAKEIIFKADKFEYSQEPTAAATAIGPAPGVSGGGSTTPAVGPSPAPVSGGGAAIGAATASGGTAATPTDAANLSGLDFAGGVDQRIKPAIAEKTKEIQSAFGKKLVITSGFRDPARNARAGGALGSTHMSADAVDVQFAGNEQDTINLIKVASQKGIGGIGVYRPGFVHLDTGPKRVWGPATSGTREYRAASIPQWAKPALDEHMGRAASPTAGGAQVASDGAEGAGTMSGASQQTATPVSAAPAPSAGGAMPTAGGASVATPTPAAPSSGATVARASTADEVSSRMPSSTPSTPTTGGSAPSSPNSPSPSFPAIDPNNPGDVEPPDAAQRYARLFNMAA